MVNFVRSPVKGSVYSVDVGFDLVHSSILFDEYRCTQLFDEYRCT